MKNVVIVGGGAGGIELATFLGDKLGRKKPVSYTHLTLIDDDPNLLGDELDHQLL